TRPLDVDDLLAQAPLEEEPRMPAAIGIGHVHLKVSDVSRAVNFYRDVLGFAEHASMPSAAFLAAGGYHHHVGLNSWQSEGAGSRGSGARKRSSGASSETITLITPCERSRRPRASSSGSARARWRWRSYTARGTIRLTVPHSSSNSRNIVPLAVPGRWRAMT